jgi:hypothetical protein
MRLIYKGKFLLKRARYKRRKSMPVGYRSQVISTGCCYMRAWELGVLVIQLDPSDIDEGRGRMDGPDLPGIPLGCARDMLRVT